MFSKSEAVSAMNSWGGKRIPFLFIVDFEMKGIRIFRLDKAIPPYIQFEFPGYKKAYFNTKAPDIFKFQKYPLEFESYFKAFEIIQAEIHAGNTFLANLTFPTRIETNFSLAEIYNHCHARYKLMVDNEFVCFSPETFVKINDGIITTCPMKGTINGAVENASEIILSDRKEVAEHSTIVDLLRNDLSRFAYNVHVKRFRYVEPVNTHEGTLLQVSTEISGSLPEGYHHRLGDILFSLLPAGSVTGAPKHETIRIIRQAEKADRGYYTGICGIFDGTSLDSAVLIRYIEIKNGIMQFRSGGGITFLSDALKEYQELIDKVYVPIAGNN